MGDPRRAWLALQRDLGGNEVIFDAPLEIAPIFLSAEAPSPPSPPPVLAKVVAEQRANVRELPSAAPLWNARVYPEGQVPVWAVDAPAIPGMGLTVTLPEAANAVSQWNTLEEVAASVATCRACPLCEGRTHPVPGEGNPTAALMVVGEGPGEQEDLSGRPFVGRAGALLDKMLGSIDLPREEVFIANVVKCRPPRNRAPLPDERDACLPYLQRQISLVRPRVILALGGTAAEALLGVKQSLGSLRLKVHMLDSIPLIVTYHPAALLRNPNWKRPAWDDLRIARQLVDARS